MYMSSIPLLYMELSNKEAATVFGILPFVSYSDGILRYNRKIVTLKFIADFYGDDYGCFKKTISSLMKKGIIRKTKRPSDTNSSRTKECYVINPYIFLRGADIENDIADLFSDKKWANLP